MLRNSALSLFLREGLRQHHYLLMCARLQALKIGLPRSQQWSVLCNIRQPGLSVVITLGGLLKRHGFRRHHRPSSLCSELVPMTLANVQMLYGGTEVG